MMLIKKENFKLKKGEPMIFIMAALTGIVLYFVFENKGLTMTSASNASMLVAAIPAFALLLKALLKGGVCTFLHSFVFWLQ